MKYFIDTEFLEGTQKEKFPISLFRKETVPTIDLISIGIVSEDSREYYAVSKEFNLQEAWNRHDLQLPKEHGEEPVKVYWIRENVLQPIFYNLAQKEYDLNNGYNDYYFCYNDIKELINKYGKTRKQIAEEVKEFCIGKQEVPKESLSIVRKHILERRGNPVFYGYYSAYDHVCLSWIFGKMIDLPKGFPMYTIDLQQIKEEIEDKYREKGIDFSLAEDSEYPQQDNEHNSLSDARWNRELHNFLKTKRK